MSASVRGVEIFDTETAFLARAGEVSTVDFADPSVPAEVFEPFVVIDDVHYEISAGRAAKCFQSEDESCWRTAEDDGVRKLWSSAFHAVAMEEWAFGAGDWDVIRFGDKRSVTSVGFYFHSLFPGKPPGFVGWEILVHERDGTTTSVTVPPLTDGKPAYFGFVSDTGIWMIDVGSMPGPMSLAWAYEAVSHSPVIEHESEAPTAAPDAQTLRSRAPADAKRLDNDRLERREGLYYDARTDKPATGMVELRHANGQAYVRAYLDGGKKNGPETHWHPNGQMSSEMFYLQGRKHGRQQEWHVGGEKLSDVFYYQGRKEGLATWWYASGQKEIEITFRLGRREGIERRWFETGELQSSVLYVADAPEGTAAVWHANGEKRSEGNFTDGKKHGRFIEWYENGQQSMTQELKGGVRVGRQTQWYEDGQLKAEIDFLDGEFHGRAAWYYPDGSLELEFHFREGKLHGLGRQWHANGQIKSQGEFKNGKKVGKHLFWDENGRKLRRRPRDYPTLPEVT
jgi:antitoxin component YwqK of YwqJK toxin-antitoxin module